MAAILPQAIGKGNVKLHAVKVDMTPMVDLGFLLITFFIFTTSMMEPHTTKLVMPKESNATPMPVYDKTLLTAILDYDKVTVYEGAFEKAVAANALQQTGYNMQTGLGNSIRVKQKSLQAEGLKDDMMVIIKPLPSATYQDVLNALDEMQINGVKRYAIIDASVQEKAAVKK